MDFSCSEGNVKVMTEIQLGRYGLFEVTIERRETGNIYICDRNLFAKTGARYRMGKNYSYILRSEENETLTE